MFQALQNYSEHIDCQTRRYPSTAKVNLIILCIFHISKRFLSSISDRRILTSH